MKKTFITFAVFIIAITTSTAQEISNQTIGLRLGNYNGISYQKKITDDSRAELTLAWRGYTAYSDVKADVAYHKVFNLDAIDSNMNWYLGIEGGAGFWKYESNYYYSYYDYNDSGTYFFVGGVAGIEYKFENIPLLLTLDTKPEIVFGNFYNGFHINGSIGIRYTL